jgi:flagellar brake protein
LRDDTMRESAKSPAPEAVDDIPDQERYRVGNPLEIAALLKAALKNRTLVTVSYGEEGRFFVSALLAVRREHGDVIIDSGPDEEVNARVIASPRIVVGAMLDSVRLQFPASEARATTYQGYRAMSLPFPEYLLHMQRRKFFRVSIPPGERLVCEVWRLPEDLRPVRLPVIDISCGGVALENWPDGQAPEAMHIYRHCRLRLGEDDLHVDLEVVNVIDRTDGSGRRVRRCGARFVNMPERLATQVQRYIMRIERKLLETRREADEKFGRAPSTRK